MTQETLSTWQSKKTFIPADFVWIRANVMVLSIWITQAPQQRPLTCWARVSFCECDTLLDRFVSKVADTVHVQSASFHHFVGPGHRYRPSSGSHFRWLCSHILFCGRNCLTLPAEYQKTIVFSKHERKAFTKRAAAEGISATNGGLGFSQQAASDRLDSQRHCLLPCSYVQTVLRHLIAAFG